MTSVCKHIKVILLKICENQGMNLIKLNPTLRLKLQWVMTVFIISRCRKILLLCGTGGYRNKNLECDIHIDDLYMMGLY